MRLLKLLKRSKDSSRNATVPDPASSVPAYPGTGIPATAESALSPVAARARSEADTDPTAAVNAVPVLKTVPADDIHVYVQSTPNPNAYKLILNRDVKIQGTATYNEEAECDNDLARGLIGVPGVQQVYFFDNVVTVTLNPSVPFSELRERFIAVIKDKLPAHDPNYKTPDDIKKQDYGELPEALQRINEILDRTIRPGLQGDGGDLEILSYTGNQLSVRYQGACGSCPSSTAGTLQAINSILRDEFDPDIEVVPV